MVYFSPHIRALDAQIEYLKARLEKVEQEKREVEELGRQRVSVALERLAEAEKTARVREDALAGRLAKVEEGARQREDTLLDRIAKLSEAACQRGDALLDRLLVKNNVAPVAEPLTSAPPSVELITPYDNMGPEARELYRTSYIKEEMEWLMREDSTIDEGTAHAIAEQNYIIKHQVMK